MQEQFGHVTVTYDEETALLQQPLLGRGLPLHGGREIIIQDLLGDLAQVTALGALFHIDGNGDLRIIRRGKQNKRSVIRALGTMLRRAGLTADGNVVISKNILRRALCRA